MHFENVTAKNHFTNILNNPYKYSLLMRRMKLKASRNLLQNDKRAACVGLYVCDICAIDTLLLVKDHQLFQR